MIIIPAKWNYLKDKLEKQRRLRRRRQIELDCLSSEIDNLEDMIFKIERESGG